MTLHDYIKHYLAFPDLLLFFAVSLSVVLLIHYILLLAAKKTAAKTRLSDRENILIDAFHTRLEHYYELIFSSTSILFFTGIYFLLDFDYFSIPGRAWNIWTEYGDFILLGFIIISIIFNNITDHVFIPLRHISRESRSILRMAGMLYMLVIFAYIKFIYLDDNYDSILFYFITMVIGRFVYFDASFKDFLGSMKELFRTLPYLFLVLLSTAVLSLYGFGSGYLLRSNGVVVSVFLAHFFVIAEIFLLTRFGFTKRMGNRCIRRFEKTNHQNPSSRMEVRKHRTSKTDVIWGK